MSNFSIDTAVKAIPNFSGNYKELDSFTTIISLLNNSLNETGKTDLLKFAFHVKLSINVKTALGRQSPPDDLESLIKLLKERYKNNVTLPQNFNRLSNMTQRNLSVTSFKDHLLNTISDLNRLQIEQLGSTATEIQKQVIVTTNEMQALHIFKNGLDDKIKTTVIAAQPKTLTDAVNIALEVDTSNSNQIMHINRASNNKRYNNNTNYYNSNRNSNFPNRNNTNNNFNRNKNFPNNFYNNNSYRNNNNQSFNNNSHRNNNNNNHRNYYNNQQQRHTNNNNNNHYRNNINRTARVHLTNEQGNDQGSDSNNPESQN